MSAKTHWLQNPNKNYLGHWDLPNGDDFTLTIETAQWEGVENPILSRKNAPHIESKRVIRFKEKGVKPFICNEVNASSIIKATGVSFMEDAKGNRITLYVGKYQDKRTKTEIDCIRIRTSKELNLQQLEQEINNLFNQKAEIIEQGYIDRIKEIIENKEVLSYKKTFEYLKTLK
ncbi:MAG: hypothetical protein ACPGRW_06240 [Flavobacteriaceae bacterium]